MNSFRIMNIMKIKFRLIQSIGQGSLLGALLVAGIFSTAFADKLYYNIAHQINSSKLFDWAGSQGANAIEADFRFKGVTPINVKHGFPCDCTASPLADMCQATRNVIGGITAAARVCNLEDSIDNFLNQLATKSFALLIVDTKAGTIDGGKSNLEQAGVNMISKLNQQLFAKGYTGKVIVGVSDFKYFPYLQGAARAAQQSAYASRVYFSIDQEKDVNKVVSLLQSLQTANITYGVGISAFVPNTFYTEIQTSANYINNNTLVTNYIWTIDKEASMQNYLNVGVRGVMTNNPSKLNNLYQQFFRNNPGARYGTPSDPGL